MILRQNACACIANLALEEQARIEFCKPVLVNGEQKIPSILILSVLHKEIDSGHIGYLCNKVIIKIK